MPEILDLIDPEELVGFVREREYPELTTLDDILPYREVASTELSVMRDGRVDVNAAKYRAFDAEAPIGTRPAVERIKAKIPPLSQKIPLGEEETLMLEANERGNTEPLIEAVYNDADAMNRSVFVRLAVAKGQALYTGKVTINENRVVAEADYGVPAGHFVAPATLWSNPAATILADLRTWMATYRTSNLGLRPGAFIISETILGYMLLNTEIRQLVGTTLGTPSMVTEETLGQILRARGLPPFRLEDTQVMVDGAAQYLIPQDRVVFVPPPNFPLGVTVFGITAEAVKLRTAGQITVESLQGPVATVSQTGFDPVVTWTKATALAVPIIVEPKRLLVADVA